MIVTIKISIPNERILREGVTLADARREFESFAQEMAGEQPPEAKFEVTISEDDAP